MEPEPSPGMGWAGETIIGRVSSSLKTRSLAAMAACRMLYFSLRSWMGRKKRCAYWMKRDGRTPMPTSADEAGAARMPSRPPRQMTQAIAGEQEFDAGIVPGVGEDGVCPGALVLGVDGGEVGEGAPLAVEELHDGHAARHTPG